MAKGICSFDGCERPVFARMLCGSHYRKWRLVHNPQPPCAADGCDLPARTRQLCSRHYQRWLKDNEDWRPKGPSMPPEVRAKMASSKRGEQNPMFGKTREKSPRWRGDSVGYFGVHDWMSDNYGQPKFCEQCGTTDPQLRYEWANISGEYRRDRTDFKRLCKKCHNDHDGVNAYQVGAPSRKNRPMAAVKGKPVSSGYKGVRASGYGTWRATFAVNGKYTNLGTFATEEAAARAYNAAVIEAHGEDAYVNEIP